MVIINCSAAALSNQSSSDNDSLSPDEQLEKIITKYTMDYGVPYICAFGMLGNVLNFLVLTREKISHSLTKMEKSAHIGLIGLAISDFMFCLLAFTYSQMTFQDYYSEVTAGLYFSLLIGPCITWFIVTSTWLTVAMAGERYLAVCHPFKARKIISLRKTRIIIFMVYIVCLGFTIPLGFEKTIASQNDCDGNIVYSIEKRPEFTDTVISIRRLAWAIVFDFIPCIALLYFNICLIYKIHHAKRLRNAMAPAHNQEVLLTKYPRELFSYNSNSGSTNTNSVKSRHDSFNVQLTKNTIHNNHNNHKHMPRHSSDRIWRGGSPQGSMTRTPVKTQMRARRRHTDNALNSVTATLIAVVVLFLILVSPSEVLKSVFVIREKTNTHTYSIILNITNLMQSINFSVNFILYCAVNKSFRKSLAVIFCFFCKRGRRAFKLRTLERAYCHKMDFSESDS